MRSSKVHRNPLTGVVTLSPVRSSPLAWLRQRALVLDGASESADQGFEILFAELDYAASKKANELMGYTYSHLYGLPASGPTPPCVRVWPVLWPGTGSFTGSEPESFRLFWLLWLRCAPARLALLR